MNKDDKSYWQKRQEQKFLAGEKQVKAYYKELKKSFEQAKKEVQQVINEFYGKYAKENKVSWAAAHQMLSQEEIRGLNAFIALAKENMNKYNQELNNMSIRARITRYQALEKQIDAILQQLYAIEYQVKGEDLLKEVYTGSYYRTWYNIDLYSGFHQEFAQVNTNAVEELIKYPFNGANFSDRLWRQKDYMLQQLRENITTMLVQGKNPNTLSYDFAKKFDVREFEAYRLLHTEGAFIAEQGSLEAYKQDCVEKYEILATLDNKTSEICRDEDGEIYNIDEAVVGENYPPYHQFCRTTTIPFYDDMERETRVARASDGKSYKVPANMNFSQWHREYIESNPEGILSERKLHNINTDKKLYKQYKNILGSDAPKSLEDFQNLKYNNVDYFNYLRLDHTRRIKLIDNPEIALPNYDKVIVRDQKFTNYLFGGEDVRGLAKGKAFSSRLGYTIDNWKQLQNEIINRASLYPATFKQNNGFGDLYEQKIVIYGLKGKPANVIVGWIKTRDDTYISMTSAYIKEVK